MISTGTHLLRLRALNLSGMETAYAHFYFEKTFPIYGRTQFRVAHRVNTAGESVPGSMLGREN